MSLTLIASKVRDWFTHDWYVQNKCVWCSRTGLLLYCHTPGQKPDFKELSFSEIIRLIDELDI
jgi:hypothetical protein